MITEDLIFSANNQLTSEWFAEQQNSTFGKEN